MKDAQYEQVSQANDDSSPAPTVDSTLSPLEIDVVEGDDKGDHRCRPPEESRMRQESHLSSRDGDDRWGESDSLALGVDAPPTVGRVYRTPVDIDYAEATVISPCDLAVGELLRIDLGRNRLMIVEAPAGGVSAGDTFRTGYRMYNWESPDSTRSFRRWRHHRDTEEWSAQLCGCCEFGPCHPSFLGSICCRCVLLSQVMTRMNLNWIGEKVSPRLAHDTVTGVVAAYIGFSLVVLVLYFAISNRAKKFSSDDGDRLLDDIELVGLILAMVAVNVAFFCYILLIFVRTRISVRETYSIPGNECTDCFVSCWCPCCALSQMARQTADYRRFQAKWCSDTGLPFESDAEYGLDQFVNAQSMERDVV